jgi:hypothetical protein
MDSWLVLLGGALFVFVPLPAGPRLALAGRGPADGLILRPMPRPDGPLAPHPTLPSYFRDERERRTLVDHLFDVTAAHYDAVIGAMSLGSGTLVPARCTPAGGLDARDGRARPGHGDRDRGQGGGLADLAGARHRDRPQPRDAGAGAEGGAPPLRPRLRRVPPLPRRLLRLPEHGVRAAAHGRSQDHLLRGPSGAPAGRAAARARDHAPPARAGPGRDPPLPGHGWSRCLREPFTATGRPTPVPLLLGHDRAVRAAGDHPGRAADAGFVRAERNVVLGIFSEYLGVKSG